ncbi:hypothetical protein GCM10011573_29280 [Enterococcus wangshanyuanii]|uniref:Transposase n=1 Tax=Enterococcus wangshanyuanii TaxID=2005703 RepID=A0ABQ1PIV1_9ENTE|nr:hypothetical protein GCM10011573_29280 [Enterococcus wangshanyuanii]
MFKNENQEKQYAPERTLKIGNTVFILTTNFTPTEKNKQNLLKAIKRLIENYEISQ